MKHIAKKRNSRWLGWEGQVLIDEIENGNPKGRNQYYKSIVIKNPIEIISAKTITKDNNMEKFSQAHGDLHLMNLTNYDNKLTLGKTIMVRVTGYSNHSLEGIQII